MVGNIRKTSFDADMNANARQSGRFWLKNTSRLGRLGRLGPLGRLGRLGRMGCQDHSVCGALPLTGR